MRVGSHARSETLAYERMADQLMDGMTGYVRRQNTTVADKAMLVAMFEEWANQVRTLEWKIGEAEATIKQQQSRIAYLQWKLTTLPWKRFWNYCTFLTGFRQWPSSQ
jgi:hypothetical protein